MAKQIHIKHQQNVNQTRSGLMDQFVDNLSANQILENMKEKINQIYDNQNKQEAKLGILLSEGMDFKARTKEKRLKLAGKRNQRVFSFCFSRRRRNS